MSNIEVLLSQFDEKYPNTSEGIKELEWKLPGNPLCIDGKIEALTNFLYPASSISLENPNPAFGIILREILEEFKMETIQGNYSFHEYMEKNSWKELEKKFYYNEQIRKFMKTHGANGIDKIKVFLENMKRDLVDEKYPEVLDILDHHNKSILHMAEQLWQHKIPTIKFIPVEAHGFPIPRGTIVKYATGELDTIKLFPLHNPYHFGKKVTEVEQKVSSEGSGGVGHPYTRGGRRESRKIRKSRKSIKSRKLRKSGKSRKLRKSRKSRKLILRKGD